MFRKAISPDSGPDVHRGGASPRALLVLPCHVTPSLANLRGASRRIRVVTLRDPRAYAVSAFARLTHRSGKHELD